MIKYISLQNIACKNHQEDDCSNNFVLKINLNFQPDIIWKKSFRLQWRKCCGEEYRNLIFKESCLIIYLNRDDNIQYYLDMGILSVKLAKAGYQTSINKLIRYSKKVGKRFIVANANEQIRA